MTARTLILATCAAVALLVTAAPKPAHAEYWEHEGWRERHYQHERWEAERREREWRAHEWREHHRYYGW